MRQKLPIGVQTFSEIIDRNLLYVDKTEHIHRLITSGKHFFLSLPRRFGKSLTLSTIKSIFAGERALFQGLWIEDEWDWETTHPNHQEQRGIWSLPAWLSKPGSPIGNIPVVFQPNSPTTPPTSITVHATRNTHQIRSFYANWH